jgi:spoIIIJ-associated protein
MSVDNNAELVQDDDAGAVQGDGDSPSAVSRLDEEGDVAADYLEELLDIADVDGDIDIEVRNGRTYISIVSDEESDNLKALIGRDGEVLEALQELTRLSVLSATDNRSRLILDISGYRAERNGELARIAHSAVDRVKQNGDPVALAPMGPYERKIVHDIIAELGCDSESEGEGSERHIIVSAAE